MDKTFLKAIAMLVGTIIGAGVLGLPYVFYKAGFWTGLLVIVVIGAALLLLHLYLGEIALRTKGRHQLTGYAEKYLGPWGKRIMTFSMVFGITGALVAYILGEGATIHALLGFGNSTTYSIIFFVIMAFFIYKGLRLIGESELWLNMVMLGVIIVICIIATFYMDFQNIKTFDIKNFFIPYGVIIFAAIGTPAIPEAKEILIKHRKMLKKAIIIGSLIPLVLYLVFSFIMVGVIGSNFDDFGPEQRIASVALGLIIGEKMNIFANLFAIISMATSFLALGLALKWVFQFDYKMKEFYAWSITCFIPFAIAMAGVTTFIKTLGLVGAVMGGIDGILIVLMHRNAKKYGEIKPEYSITDHPFIGFVLISIFVVGMIVSVLF